MEPKRTFLSPCFIFSLGFRFDVLLDFEFWRRSLKLLTWLFSPPSRERFPPLPISGPLLWDDADDYYWDC